MQKFQHPYRLLKQSQQNGSNIYFEHHKFHTIPIVFKFSLTPFYKYIVILIYISQQQAYISLLRIVLEHRSGSGKTRSDVILII